MLNVRLLSSSGFLLTFLKFFNGDVSAIRACGSFVEASKKGLPIYLPPNVEIALIKKLEYARTPTQTEPDVHVLLPSHHWLRDYLVITKLNLRV